MSAPQVPSAPEGRGGEIGTGSPIVSSDPDGAEDPRRRAARLRRRRRLLAWGGAPAAVVTVVSVWMGFVFLMTLAANRAAIAGDYPTAVSRYETVAKADPWLDKWRVHYNLGTARLLNNDVDGSITELEEALTTAPAAGMVAVQLPDGTETQVRDPRAPECLVRVNLYIAYLSRASGAAEAGDEAGAKAAQDQATAAAGECEVPPPPDSSPTPSPDPTNDPSSDPSGEPSSGPSGKPSDDPSSGPSSSASASPGETPTPVSETTSPATPSPSPGDSQREKLKDRNGRANGDSTGGPKGNRQW
ncbi:tetratricopeptide repeat protein [Actinomyces israelii]